ncbi:MAG: hypothetical protein ABIO67_04940 [Mycobacteriales bacterium]
MNYSPDEPTPSGRRDNGLASTGDWGALVDLDPRLSETMLGSLAAVGVAAYVEPASGVDTVSRAVALPRRPLDRLWVDPNRADEARAVVGAEIADLTALLAEDEPEASVSGFIQPIPRTAAVKVLAPPVLPAVPGVPVSLTEAASPSAEPAGASRQADEADPDEAWRQIVEGWTKDSEDTPVPRWPVTEDVDPTPAPATPQISPARRPRDAIEDVDALPAWLEPEALDDEGHYVPPPPPPVPKVKRHTVGALVCLVIGFLLVFAPNVLGQVSSTGLGTVGIALMVGGAGALVWHMRDAPDIDRGPDDGAVV